MPHFKYLPRKLTDTMKVALFQMDLAWENKQANFIKVESLMEKIKDKNIDLVILPELFSTGYTMNSDSLAEDIRGETFQFLSHVAQKYNLNILGSLIEKKGDTPRNSAIVINNKGALIAHYSKIHLPKFTDEVNHFAAGKELSLFEVKSDTIGITICYDVRFPELFRMLSEKGAQCIITIASWPVERIQHWDLLLRARALENQLFVIGVNRAGVSPSGTYPGHSKIIDPLGNILVEAPEKEDNVVYELDFSEVDRIRKELPIQDDRKLKISF